MAETIDFELVSPERVLLSAPVEMAVVPGVEGDFGVLPRHAPMVSTLRPGVISIWHGGAVERRIFVAGGFAEVVPERCTVLAEEAIALDEADAGMAEARIARARGALEDATGDAERRAAERRLAVAEALGAAVRARRD